MTSQPDTIRTLSSHSETDKYRRESLLTAYENCPIPPSERLLNPALYIERPVLSRILYIDELYRQIVGIPGVIMEFGVRWGQNMALFNNLRGIYEPYNFARKVIGFDTFTGFPSIDPKDGDDARLGDYSVTSNYKDYLEGLLSVHALGSPLPHLKKFDIIVGDATITIDDYLQRHQETVVALAYFDFDIYEPTKVCLEKIKGRLAKGSVVAFDELNCPSFPGETTAVMEVLGLNNLRLRASPHCPYTAYAIIE